MENARLKKLLAEAELDKAMRKELAEGTSDPRSAAAGPSSSCANASGSPKAEPVGSPPVPLHPAASASSPSR